MTNDVEDLFMCLLAICIYFLVKYMVKYFVLFNWAICFLIIESTIKSTKAVIFIFKGTWVRFLHIQ